MFRILLIGILLCLSVAMSFAQKPTNAQRYTSLHQPTPFIHTMKFQLEGKLLFIWATIDEQSGWVLIDSGCPDILINEKMFEDKRRIIEDSYLQDLTGTIMDKECTIVDIQVERLRSKKQSVVFMDLSAFCKKKNRLLIGILGYAFLKKYETVIDYSQKEITFFELNRKGKRKNKAAVHIAPTHTIALKKYNHFLYLKGKIGDQSIKFGLDLGAENNIVGQYKMKKIAPHFTPNKNVYLVSFNGKEKVRAGNLSEVIINDSVFDFQNVLLIDLKRLYTIKGLDAILGYDFLSNWTIAINYKNQTLCLW